MAEGVRQNIFDLDEAYFGRARINQRAVRQMGGSRRWHLTIIMTISPEAGLIYFDLMYGGLRAEIFGRFLHNSGDVIEEFEATIVMDNAPPHKAAQMEYEGYCVVRPPTLFTYLKSH